MKLWQKSMIFLARNQLLKKIVQSHKDLSLLATKYVGGKDIEEVTRKCRSLKDARYSASLFFLGEYVQDALIINKTINELKTVCRNLAKLNLDIHISVDPTQIGYLINESACKENFIELTKELNILSDGTSTFSGNFLMLDMEDSSLTDSTLRIYHDLKKLYIQTAITLQAYLYRTKDDLLKIINEEKGIVRLVKGAFAEKGDIAFTNRNAISKNYMELAELILSPVAKKNNFYPVFATYDKKIIDMIIKTASKNDWKKHEYEFEMCYGVLPDLQEKLVKSGEHLRLYIPFGTDWWPYAIRRIGESPKNIKFILKSLLASKN